MAERLAAIRRRRVIVTNKIPVARDLPGELRRLDTIGWSQVSLLKPHEPLPGEPAASRP
jgi:hypothetical protein